MVRVVLLFGLKSGLMKSLSSGKVLQLLCEEVVIYFEQYECFFVLVLIVGEVFLLLFLFFGFKLILLGFFWIFFCGICFLVVICVGGLQCCGEIFGGMEVVFVDGEDEKVEFRFFCCINCFVNIENVLLMFILVLVFILM